jgi:hypothetical protein
MGTRIDIVENHRLAVRCLGHALRAGAILCLGSGCYGASTPAGAEANAPVVEPQRSLQADAGGDATA